MKKAIYAGSFDVIHNGHIDVIKRALNLFPSREIVIIVANNRDKKHMFSAKERFSITKESLKDLNVKVIMFDGLISDYANQNNGDVMIRGIRNGKDLDYEVDLEQMTRLTSNMETVYLTPYTEHIHTSSSAVRRLISINRSDLVCNYMDKNGFLKMKNILERN